MLLTLGLTICLLAMHSLMGVQTLPGPGPGPGAVGLASARASQSVVPDQGHLLAALDGDQSGSGSMSVSAMDRCISLIVVSGFPLMSLPLLAIALQLTAPAVHRRARASRRPGPPIPHASAVLRI